MPTHLQAAAIMPLCPFLAPSKIRTGVLGLLAASGTSLLVGCGTPTKLGKLYEGPDLPSSAVATVVRMDSFDRSGNLVSYDWIAYVNAVDGQKIGAFTRVQITPGQHKLSLSCELNPKHTGYACRPAEVEITAVAGKTYFPAAQCVTTMTATTPTKGPLPTTVWTDSKGYGYCTPAVSLTRAQ